MALRHLVCYHFCCQRADWHELHADVDLKKASKFLAQKFATGASVTKNAQGQDEIVVQGDVSDDVLELIEGGAGPLKGVPAHNVVIVEEKKKKTQEWLYQLKSMWLYNFMSGSNFMYQTMIFQSI